MIVAMGSRGVSVLVGLVVLGAAGLVAQAAYGCSCAGVPAEDKLARADGAFVGTVVERRDAPVGSDGLFSSGDPSELRFRVERAYKGQLGEQVVVHTVRSGATCGLDAQPGDRLGLTVHREEGRWEAGLCDRVDPEELRRAAAPGPPVTGAGPARYLLAGEFGNTGVLALDADGRVLGSGKGSPPPLIDVCPGAKRAVESDPVSAGLVVRDVATMEVVRELPTRGEPVALDCRSADARVLTALVRSFDGGEARVVRYVGDRVRTLRRLPAREAAFAGDVAWVTKTGSRPGILRVSARTGRAIRVADGRFSDIAAAPGGRRVAARDASGRLSVVSTGTVRRGPRTGPPTWTGSSTLVARRTGEASLTTFNHRLVALRRARGLTPDTSRLVTADRGSLASIQDGRLVTAGARSGDPRRRAEIPRGKPSLLVALGRRRCAARG